MRLIVADTGPLHYLVLIGHSELLPRLFEHISIPSAVRDELAHSEAPLAVRQWISSPPTWLDVVNVLETAAAEHESLDAGERAALALAATLQAELVLMDDRSGVAAARRRGFAVTGTIGVLDLAAHRGFIRHSRNNRAGAARPYRLRSRPGGLPLP